MSIERMKNGRYRVRWRDASGRQRCKTEPFKEAAKDFEASLRHGGAGAVTAPKLTFAELAARWLVEHCDVAKAASSRVDDRQRLNTYLIPAWGDRLLPSITRADAIGLRSRLVAGGLSPKTANDTIGLARKLLNDAVEWELLTRNPLSGLKRLPHQQQPISYWLREERDRFLNYCRSEDAMLHDLVLVAVHTGLRLGELLGLCRDAVDLERGVITVRRIVCPRTSALIEQTKSKRTRDVPMNAAVRGTLERVRRMAASERVFRGLPRHNKVVLALRKMARRAGVRPIRFHDLRHTFAAHMAMAGTDLQTLRQLLGHADYTMTLRYAHLHPSHLASATERLCVPAVYSGYGETCKSLKI